MPLKARITEDMKNAMRAKDSARLSTIRLLLAAIKQREVDERIELTDADVLAVIDRMVKQRRDSISQFEAGHRADLVAAERAEVDVLSALPAGAGHGRGNRRADRRDHRRDRRGRGRRHGQGDGGAETPAGRPGRPGRRVGPGQVETGLTIPLAKARGLPIIQAFPAV